jgi:predicted dehydrogenase
MVPSTRRTSSSERRLAPRPPRAPSASDKINVAVVGLRGRGNSLLETFAAQKDVVVTHLCDLDPKVLDQRAAALEKKTGRKPAVTKDYRTCLEDKELHAIVLGTPDHWHAIPTIHCCQAGKDVYVEKPDGHKVVEAADGRRARKHERMVSWEPRPGALFLKDDRSRRRRVGR